MPFGLTVVPATLKGLGNRFTFSLEPNAILFVIIFVNYIWIRSPFWGESTYHLVVTLRTNWSCDRDLVLLATIGCVGVDA